MKFYQYFFTGISTAPKRILDSFIAQMPTKVIDASCFTETSKNSQSSVKRFKQITLFSRPFINSN